MYLIEALANFFESVNIEPIVDFLELLPRDLTNGFPRFMNCRLMALKSDDVFVGPFLEIFLLVKTLFRLFVELLQVGNFWNIGCIVGKEIDQMRDQHTELGAPIANMINSKDFVPEGLK